MLCSAPSVPQPVVQSRRRPLLGLVGAFNQEKALVGAFSVIVQPVVEPMEHYTALPGGAAALLPCCLIISTDIVITALTGAAAGGGPWHPNII